MSEVCAFCLEPIEDNVCGDYCAREREYVAKQKAEGRKDDPARAAYFTAPKVSTREISRSCGTAEEHEQIAAWMRSQEKP